MTASPDTNKLLATSARAVGVANAIACDRNDIVEPVAALTLPSGFEVACVTIEPGDDRRSCGQRAARAALGALGVSPDRLAYDGPRPVVLSTAAEVLMTAGPTPSTHGVTASLGDALVDAPARTADHIAVSITHSKTIAIAVAARARRLGIDLCEDDPRLPRLAERFLVDELAIVRSPGELTACFAAKEAALKALGVGLVDGGVLDGTAVRVVSLDPPRLSVPGLELVIVRVPAGALAVAYEPG